MGNKYNVILANRKRKGGGSAILIDSKIPFQTIFTGSKFECEIASIKLFLTHPILITCVYRPPNCTIQNTKKLLKFLSNSNCKKQVICGDFNFPKHNWGETIVNDNPFSIPIINFINENNLTQHVKESTRENSILDLVFSNPNNLLSGIDVIENFSISDHKIVSFDILECPIKQKEEKIYKRNKKDKF